MQTMTTIKGKRAVGDRSTEQQRAFVISAEKWSWRWKQRLITATKMNENNKPPEKKIKRNWCWTFRMNAQIIFATNQQWNRVGHIYILLVIVWLVCKVCSQNYIVRKPAVFVICKSQLDHSAAKQIHCLIAHMNDAKQTNVTPLASKLLYMETRNRWSTQVLIIPVIWIVISCY